MTRASKSASLALLLAAAGAAFAQSDLPAASFSATLCAEPCMQLQLADGSIVRVPSDRVERRIAVPGGVEPGSAVKRAPQRPRAQVFDPGRPGAVASVRG